MKILNRFMTAALITAGFWRERCGSETPRWPEQKANAWYARQLWLVGSNYTPKSAINQLEMWQDATFNPQEIDQELTWGRIAGHEHHARLSPTTCSGNKDAAGFQKRIDRF